MGIFQHDGVDRNEIERIVDEYPGQSIDFFGAMRARVYDDKVTACLSRADLMSSVLHVSFESE